MRLKLVLGLMVVWWNRRIEEFPNIEAVQKYTAALKELNWFRYCESTNVLGIKSES